MAGKRSKASDASASVREAERQARLADAELVTAKAQTSAVGTSTQTPAVLGNRALDAADARRASLQTAARACDDAIGPLLNVEQTRKVLGGLSQRRLDQLVKTRRLITVTQRDGTRQFPAWQFDPSGRPYRPVVDAFATMSGPGCPQRLHRRLLVHQSSSRARRTDPPQWIAEGHPPDGLHLVAPRDAERLAH